MKKITFVLSIVLFTGVAQAQRKMDLDDVSIQGQLHDDGRLRMVSRDDYQITNHVKLRKNFRTEMTDELPRPAPVVKYHY